MNAIIHVHYKLIRSVTTDKKPQKLYIFLYPLLINQVHIEFIRYYFLFQSRELLPYVFSRGSFHFEKKTYLLSSYGVLTSCVINLFTQFKRLFFESVHKISTGFVLKKLSISVWIFLFVSCLSIELLDLRLQIDYTRHFYHFMFQN